MNSPQNIGTRIIITVAGLGMGIMFSHGVLAACVGIREGYLLFAFFILAFSSFAAYGSFRMAYLAATGRDEWGNPLDDQSPSSSVRPDKSGSRTID